MKRLVKEYIYSYMHGGTIRGQSVHMPKQLEHQLVEEREIGSTERGRK